MLMRGQSVLSGIASGTWSLIATQGQPDLSAGGDGKSCIIILSQFILLLLNLDLSEILDCQLQTLCLTNHQKSLVQKIRESIS